MEWQVIVALALAVPIILFPAAYVWYMNLGGALAAVRKACKERAGRQAAEPTVLGNALPSEKAWTRGTRRQAPAPELLNQKERSDMKWQLAVGKTLGRVLRLASPVAVYGFLIWVVLGKFGWQMALVVGVVMPIIAVPAALVWYLNVSGLYRVMMDTRRRARRRAVARREAQVAVRS
jgi:hypothetical protein